jgi:serine/threonine-protein kinase
MAWYLLWVAEDNDNARRQVEIGLENSPNNASLLLARARVNRRDPDRWAEALTDCRRAVTLDPMSAPTIRMLGMNLLFMRRLDEAAAVLDRSLSISPGDFSAIRNRTMVELARGDLEGARAFLRRAIERVNQGEFIAYIATLDDMYWVLDDQQQDVLLDLGPEYWGGSRPDRAMAIAHTHYLRGDQETAAKWAEQAREALAQRLNEFPDDSELNSLMGVALAYLGQGRMAIELGQKAVRLYETKRTGEYPADTISLIRIYTLVGRYDEAINLIEPLLETPIYLTPGWLRIDPMFDPLRDNPRFQALLDSPIIQL